MCGIAGIFGRAGEPVDPHDLRLMAEALAHRGPDDGGVHLDGNLGLAHRRLSILDLSPAGHQPMSNEDGSVWVAYNGQLYGFEPLRDWLEAHGHRFRSRTDTEVLVHLYEEKGDALLESIDGMFAFALWDARRRRLLLARDRLGIKPLHYVYEEGRLAFASELGALLALPWLRPRLDPLGIVRYLYQSSVPGDASVLEGVTKLGPGECLVVEEGPPSRRTYWTLPDAGTALGEATLEAAAQELERRLDEAVRSHLVADVPVGTFLSGGLDSTAVTRAARKIVAGPLHTFSVRFTEDASLDESAAAVEVATALGTTHHELPLDSDCLRALPQVLRSADEPFAVASAVALHHLARFAREHVKVVLTGDGADEVFAGYPWRHEPETGDGASPTSFLRGVAMAGVRSVRGARAGAAGLGSQVGPRLGRLLSRPDERYAEIVAAFTPEEVDGLLVEDLRELGRRAWHENAVRRRYAEATDEDGVNRRLRTDLATSLTDEMLHKVDRMTMAAGLEARVPFLDRSLVEWAFRQPGRFKVASGSGKLVLRRALQASLPRIAGRRKHGFDPPLGAWLQGPLRPQVTERLSREAVKRRGLFRPEAVERVVRAHLEGRGNHARKLFTLLALEMWLEDRRSRLA